MAKNVRTNKTAVVLFSFHRLSLFERKVINHICQSSFNYKVPWPKFNWTIARLVNLWLASALRKELSHVKGLSLCVPGLGWGRWWLPARLQDPRYRLNRDLGHSLPEHYTFIMHFFQGDYTRHQGCGSGSAWIRINFYFWNLMFFTTKENSL